MTVSLIGGLPPENPRNFTVYGVFFNIEEIRMNVNPVINELKEILKRELDNNFIPIDKIKKITIAIEALLDINS